MKNQSVIIIGSGLAGYLFAKEFRKLDITTPLEIITADDGAFYAKPLLSTALMNKKSAKELVIYSADEMASQLRAKIHTATQVERIDPYAQIIITPTKKIEYQKLIIACGSQAVTPSLKGNAIADIYSVNDLAAYGKFQRWINNKKHIAILGAGLVGCEFANDLVDVGFKVEVISPDSYPLAKFVPQRVGYVLQQALSSKGVNWHFKKLTTVVNYDQNRYALTLSDGSTLTVDCVFSAVGIRANCSLARSIGLDCKQGIKVDRHLKTSIENVHALGDCAEVAGKMLQYVAPLLQSARALAGYFIGSKNPVHYPSMPVIVKTPACIIAVCKPPEGIEGEWQYSGEGLHQSALFYDRQDKLRGFALSGNHVKQRVPLTQQLPPVFE